MSSSVFQVTKRAAICEYGFPEQCHDKSCRTTVQLQRIFKSTRKEKENGIMEHSALRRVWKRIINHFVLLE